MSLLDKIAILVCTGKFFIQVRAFVIGQSLSNDMEVEKSEQNSKLLEKNISQEHKLLITCI